jgi:hypothetical protein
MKEGKHSENVRRNMRKLKWIVAVLAAAGCALAQAQTGPVGPSVLNGGNAIVSPFSTAYGDTYTSPQAEVGTTGYSFTDAYVFTTGVPGSFDSLSATINLASVLNIIDFQAGLFVGTPLASGGGSGAGSFIGNSGSTSGAVSGLAWNSGSGGVIQLSDSTLAAGTYTLELRGWVTGTNGGSYSGVLNISPVPEENALALLCAGMLPLLLAARRHAS